MPPKSRVRLLKPALRAELDRLLNEDKLTQEAIAEHLRSLGADISESQIQRYNTRRAKLADDMRMTREMANAIGRELSEVTEGSSPDLLLIESLQSLLLKVRMQQTDEVIDDRVAARLSAAVRDLSVALKNSTDFRLKLEEQAAKKAARIVERVAKDGGGISANALDLIKRQLLGIPMAEVAG